MDIKKFDQIVRTTLIMEDQGERIRQIKEREKVLRARAKGKGNRKEGESSIPS